MSVRMSQVAVNGIRINVASAGEGPPILLLHGFPHTWQVWSSVLPALSRTHRVIAPDLRGLGGTTRASSGYDVVNLSRDAEQLLDALDITRADVVGIDAGTPVAFVLAVRSPERVRRLVVMEAVLGGLPGAEAFTSGGPPWWFGFHAVPGLAERVLLGHEGEYLDHFYRSGTHERTGIDPAIRDAFVAAYTGSESLRCGFEHYRAMPTSAAQIVDLVQASRLTVPTLAIGADTVGTALHTQLLPITDRLTGQTLPDSGHIIPLDRPGALLQVLGDFGL